MNRTFWKKATFNIYRILLIFSQICSLNKNIQYNLPLIINLFMLIVALNLSYLVWLLQVSKSRKKCMVSWILPKKQMKLIILSIIFTQNSEFCSFFWKNCGNHNLNFEIVWNIKYSSLLYFWLGTSARASLWAFKMDINPEAMVN